MAEPLRVAVRIRPLQPHDGKRPGAPTVAKSTDVSLLSRCNDEERSLQFDRVFGADSSQQEVFSHCALPLVDAVVSGTNGCIFAFGQTGAGKTHSMLGPEGGRRQDAMAGVLPRAAAELFRRIAQLEADAARLVGGGYSAFEVRASFIEVYCESAFDLLGSSVSATREASSACNIREQSEPFRIYAEGAKEERVTSAAQLLEVVARGAANRATAATGVHAHSSRSHALLVLSLEHRWRPLGQEDGRRFLSRVSRLTLVDLAGSETMERSHGGSVDSAGVGTNLGLLVLGRVIHALAAGERVPYRDSTLTRLLQSSLGGSAKTQMLACISPAAVDAVQTQSTLQFASGARDIRITPEISTVREEMEADPMAGDHEDEDRLLNRRAVWIETRGFGDVFARCVGDREDPLILWVHGSGPCNSSMFWNEVVSDCARLTQTSSSGRLPASFYHVAIDCPGYGRSPGDRQTIRSYPGQFLSAVVEALGRRSAVAMCGSSQGCASLFNAALECPRLMHALAVCHPVGHAPQRYSQITQPTLLIFDTEDDGHPVSVGRQMRRYLPNNRYFEFARSTDGHWEAAHMGEELISLLEEHWPEIRSKRRGGRLDPKLPELLRVAGGYRGWSCAHGTEWLPMTRGQGAPAPSLGSPEEDGEDQTEGVAGDLWRAELEPGSNMLRYVHVASGRTVRARPPGAQILVEKLDIGAVAGSDSTGGAGRRRVQGKSPGQGTAPALEHEALFEEQDEESEDDDARREREEREARTALDAAEREAAQEACDLCGKVLIDPVRLVRCRCALCYCCRELTVRFTRQCPCCGQKVDTKDGQVASDARELVLRTAEREAQASGDEGMAFQEQRARAQELLARSNVSSRIVLEYGNTSEKAGNKTNYVTFLKAALLEGFPSKPTALIAKVEFNINPGYSKPTASVSNPDQKTGAKFEYAMARSYPCFISVHFTKELRLPPICVEYVVQDDVRTSRRIVVELPRGGLPGRPTGQVTFERAPCNGWIRYSAGLAPAVEYLQEGSDGAETEARTRGRRARKSSPAPGGGGRSGRGASVSGPSRRQGQSPSQAGGGGSRAGASSSSRPRSPSSAGGRSALQVAQPPAAAALLGAPRSNSNVSASGEDRSDNNKNTADGRGRDVQRRLQEMDTNGDLSLSLEQLASILPEMSQEELRVLFEVLNVPGDGKVAFNSLCQFVYGTGNGGQGPGSPAGLEPEAPPPPALDLNRARSDEMKSMFRQDDPSGNGHISTAQLEALLSDMTQDEVRTLVGVLGERDTETLNYGRLCDFLYNTQS